MNNEIAGKRNSGTTKQPSENLWTIRSILDWTAAFFEKQGIDSPRLDAEVLLAHALGVERLKLYLDIDRPLSDAERAPFRELVTRRGKREPVAYLVGQKEFYALALEVSPDVLVPRPETEFAVDAVLERTAQDEEFTFVDVGTGSGCIAVAIAANRPGATGFATDSSKAATRLAARNIERHDLADRVTAFCGDLLDGAREHFGKREIDIIVSNPPYVTEEEFRTLEPEIREHEPKEALLDRSPDGLQTFRRIADAAAGIIAQGGLLACELGAGRYDAAKEHLENAGTWEYIEPVREFSGVRRVITARKKKE